MDKRGTSQSPQPPWYEMRPEVQSPSQSVRMTPAAVNVINITRRPEGGIVNIEVRRQEGSPGSPNVIQSRTFGSRETSPNANVFARIPPLPVHDSRHPIDVRLRGGLGTIALHRPLADLVRAMHGQSLFERFNEPAPPVIDTAHSSVASGRRVHTIPIRVEGRHRMGGSAPPSPQRVYEIPVNVLSVKSQPSTPTSQPPSPGIESPTKVFASMSHSVMRSPTEMTSDAEKKLASLMSHLESEMNLASVGLPMRKKLPDAGLPPAAITKLKSPPPYDGSGVADTYSQPLVNTSSSDSTVKREYFQPPSPQTTPVQEISEPKFRLKTASTDSDSSASTAGSAAFHCKFTAITQ
jgi:hypothetical protein